MQTTIRPDRIDEVASTGAIAQTVYVPQYGYTISTSIDSFSAQHFSFSTAFSTSTNTSAPATTFLMTYILYQDSQTLTSAGITFTTAASATKFSIQMRSWNFLSPSNTLLLHLAIESTPTLTSITQNTSNSQVTSWTLQAGSGMVTTLHSLAAATVDSHTTPVSLSFTPSTPPYPNPIDWVLTIPHFATGFLYDPDIHTQAYPSSSGSDDPIAIIAGVVGGVAFCLLLSLLLAMILTVIFRRQLRECILGAEEDLETTRELEATMHTPQGYEINPYYNT